MPVKRVFAEDELYVLREAFHSDKPLREVATSLSSSFYPVKCAWISMFGLDAYKARISRLCSINQLGEKNTMAKRTGPLHPRYVESYTSYQGYKMIDCPDWYTGVGLKANKIAEHVIVALKAAGLTELPPYHIVHHKNHKKKDNRPENLEIMSRASHAQVHRWAKYRKKKAREGATTIPEGSSEGMMPSEAHDIRKDDDIV